MTTTTYNENVYAPKGWVVGFSTFAGVVMVISGIFQFFEGLAAILNPNFFVVGHNYAYYIKPLNGVG